MKSTAERGLDTARRTAEAAIDRIPPDAWPWIDLLFNIVIGLFIVWIVLSLVAWWRRRAYNLTIASTAKARKKAQPDFLSVDKKDRERQIARGDAHEEALDERDREEALAALKAAKEPLTIGARIAKMATFLMSIFTLLTGFSGTIISVGRIGDNIEDLTAAGRIQYLIQEHPVGVAVCLFVIGFQVWKYFSDEKWKKSKKKG